MRRRLVLAAALATVLAAGACDPASTGSPQAGAKPPEVALDLRLASSLEPFSACTPLLDHIQTEAASRATPWGLPWGAAGRGFGDTALASGSPVPTMTAARASAPAAAPGNAAAGGSEAADGSAPTASGTNVQEAGVDEPDAVKTDGRRIFSVARGRLQSLVVEDGTPRLAGSMALPEGGPHDLLLAGDRLLVRSSTWAETPVPPAALRSGDVAGGMSYFPGQPRTVLTLLDVSDPARPAVVSTYGVDGHSVGARLVGDVARVVIGAAPRGIAPAYPTDGTPLDEGKALSANRERVENTTLADWLPGYEVRAGAAGSSGENSAGLVAPCRRVSHPAEFSGLGSLSVLTFDLSEDLGDGDAVTVLADGNTVYASASALYVATTRYAEASGDVVAPQDVSTEIHKFDIAGDGPARHVGSGKVPGQLLNQFSLSEHDGRLRAATTLTGGTPEPGIPAPGRSGVTSESRVTVLEDSGDGRLIEVGSVGGLGRGERIYAVRFIGAVGYVVTFRQVDPLYTLDLSDPRAPKVVGELKIPGYSAYLHPVGDGLLLGVGQDASDQGRRLGAQVSLFDVSDPANPKRVDQVALGQGDTPVEYDHHAFLYHRGLAVVPFVSYGDGKIGPDSGAVGLSVSNDALDEAGRVSHGASISGGTPVPPEFDSSITRSVVLGDALLTFSEAGVLSSNLGDLSPLRFLSY